MSEGSTGSATSWIERWLGALIERLRSLPPEDREEVVRGAAGDDPQAMRELTTLLAQPGGPAADSVLASGGALGGALWERVAAELDRAEPAREEIGPGARIGRYVLLHRIGSGGMGSVHAAYDPELDREVAVKILRPDLFGRDDAAHEWLRREAQALARLAHPNVVTVHDVGSADGRLFLAMERVEGQDLKRWLVAERRSRREVVDLFRAIGRGLAAAHRAGLVHRDFKPQNVIVGEDGRPRILDFGLARGADDGPGGADEAQPPGTSPSRSGTVRLAGTPAYMAPEQLEGGAVDERSDQYAYCLVLWEALHGGRPFPTDSVTRLVERRRAGELPAARPGSEVPKRLRRLLQRGLAPDPGDRFTSMDELVASLDETARRPRVAAVVAAAALIGLVAWALRDRAPACRGGAELLEEVWGEPRRTAVASAFAASGHPQATAALERVATALERWTADWSRMRIDACEATHLRREQSEELLDLRFACLERRREEAEAFVDLLTLADEATVAEAPRAALGVAPIAICGDPRLLAAPAPPPAEEASRRRLDGLEASLAQAKALRDLGRPAEATEAATKLVEAAEGLVGGAESPSGERGTEPDDRPLERRWAAPLAAEAHYLLADLQDLQGDFDASEESLFETWSYALRGGHDEYVGRALNLLIWLDGNDRGDLAKGRRWAELARATLDRMDAGPLLRADFHNSLGAALQTAGLGMEALAHHEQALALRRRLFGSESYEVAKSLNNLGSAYYSAARFEEAHVHYGRALEIMERSLGDHPATAMGWSNVGSALISTGAHQEALAAHQRALDIRAALFGPESFWAAISIGNLGFAELDSDPAAALDRFERQGRVFASTLPAEHPLNAYPLSGAGLAHLALGRPREAIPRLEGALALWHASAAAVPHDLATSRFALARALWETGERTRARSLAAEALDALAPLQSADLPLREEIERWLVEHAAGARDAAG